MTDYGMTTRDGHLRWCKERALEYVEAGDLQNAFASMLSDLGKHPDTAHSAELMGALGGRLLLAGHLDTPQKMRDWIEGFN